MIDKELFKDFIESYQNFISSTNRLDQALTGKSYPTVLYDTDWYNSVGKMLDLFLDSHFTGEGEDWIFYYLFEDVEDKAAYVTKDKDIFDEKKEIRYPLDTIDGLWDFLLTDKQLYFKDV